MKLCTGKKLILWSTSYESLEEVTMGWSLGFILIFGKTNTIM